MPANYLHGVETIEIEKGPRPIRGVKTAVIGLVGSAPIYELDAADQSINELKLVLNDRDAAKYFGSQAAGYTIPQALNAIFDQGKGIVVVINVFNPATHKTSVVAESKTFNTDNVLTLNHPGTSSVVVKNAADLVTYTLTTDYTIDNKTGKIARVAAGTIAAGATVHVSYSYADPTLVTAGDIIGTVNAAGSRTGMQAWKDTYNLMGFYPKLLIAPVFCTQNSVTSELDVMAGALRAIAIVDAPIGVTYQDVIAGRGPSGAINFNYSSQRLYLMYPHLKVYNVTTETETLEPYSQRMAGVIAAKDIEKGYWWSPSNTEIKGITGVERKLTSMINDSSSETNILNETGITTTFNSFGTGIRTWGNRTAAWPSVTHPRNFLNVRRTADVIHESIEYSMLQFIDNPINDALIDAITESVNSFFRTLISRGALIDGRCWFDPLKNEVTELALGHITFDFEFMPPTPAERISFESFINIELLKNLYKAAA